MCAGLPYMCMPATCTQHYVCPLPRSAQTQLHSALYFRDYCEQLVRDDSKKVGFLCFCFFVNEGQLPLLNFPKMAKKRQKLRAFLLLVLLKECTLLCRVEEREAQAVSNILSVS